MHCAHRLCCLIGSLARPKLLALRCWRGTAALELPAYLLRVYGGPLQGHFIPAEAGKHKQEGRDLLQHTGSVLLELSPCPFRLFHCPGPRRCTLPPPPPPPPPHPGASSCCRRVNAQPFTESAMRCFGPLWVMSNDINACRVTAWALLSLVQKLVHIPCMKS